MATRKPHTLPEGFLDALKTELHRIPDAHPVDRTTGPERAKKPRIIAWSTAFISVAATAALALMLWNPAPNNELNEAELLDELYTLGYIEWEDVVNYVDADSLSTTYAVDPDVYFDYYDNPNDYLFDL